LSKQIQRQAVADLQAAGNLAQRGRFVGVAMLDQRQPFK